MHSTASPSLMGLLMSRDQIRAGAIGFADGVIDRLVDLDDGSGTIEQEVAKLEGIVHIGFSARNEVRALAGLTVTTDDDDQRAVARVAKWFRDGTIGIMSVATSKMSFQLGRSTTGALADIMAVDTFDEDHSVFRLRNDVQMTRAAQEAIEALRGTHSADVAAILIACITLACASAEAAELGRKESMVSVVADKIATALSKPGADLLPISIQTLGVEVCFVLDPISEFEPFKIVSISRATH